MYIPFFFLPFFMFFYSQPSRQPTSQPISQPSRQPTAQVLLLALSLSCPIVDYAITNLIQAGIHNSLMFLSILQKSYVHLLFVIFYFPVPYNTTPHSHQTSLPVNLRLSHYLVPQRNLPVNQPVTPRNLLVNPAYNLPNN